jgi:hypothetical protein
MLIAKLLVLEKFVSDYCNLMNWNSKKEDIHKLKFLDIYLST